MRPPKGKAGLIFMALGALGNTTRAEIGEWLARNGEPMSPADIGGALATLAHYQFPLAEMTERDKGGKGQAGHWQLTKRGRVVYDVL